MHAIGSARRSGWPAFAASVAGLALATWLYLGYAYELYPQTGFLDFVYRFDGRYTNDFHTGNPPYHWAFSHFLGWLPPGAIEPLLLVLWIAGLLVLWAGFLSIARSMGASLEGAAAAGLVAIPTVFWGFGVTPELLRLTYPTALAFALAVAALAALLRGRFLAAGALLGGATLVHPDLGLLATAAIAPALLVTSAQRRRDALRFGASWLVLGLPSVAVAVSGQLEGSSLSRAQRLDLLTVVRVPHHFAYGYFPPSEYIQFAAWAAVLAAALYACRARPQARAVAVVVGAILAICAVGAAASLVGRPLALVAAQTARLSSLLVLLGTVSAAVLLSPEDRAGRVWGAAALVGVFLLAPPLAGALTPPLRDFAVHRVSIAEGALVLVLVGGIAVGRRLGGARAVRPVPALAAAVLVVLTAVSAAKLVATSADRPPARSSELRGFVEVAERARAGSGPDDVFLTPPDIDGFRTYARRGTVVEFGSSEYGRGDAEWLRRLIAVTGSALVVDPSLGPDVGERKRLIASGYDRTLASSRLPVCRYGVEGVVARAAVPPPRWLRLAYRNRDWELLRVRRGACVG